MELSIFSAATALIAATALTWLVLRFFFGTQKATAGAMDASGERQSATITVKGGYSPAVISMRTGTPITLTFDRQETGECTSHVVFADLGLDAMLPGNATTDVELPALSAGEYPFACGMNMVHGLLRVEGEESKDGADKDGLRPRADGSAEAEGVSPSDLRVGAPVVDAAEAERREAAERANEIKALTKLCLADNVIEPEMYVKYAVNRGLRDLIQEVSIPLETVTEITDNGPKTVERKVFPGYVLVKMVMNDETWHVVRNIRGVTGFLGEGNNPIPLSEDDVASLGVEKREVVVGYQVGDSVKITDGALESFLGTVEELDLERGKVRVVVSMFGRETPVELELDQVEPMEQ